MSVAGRKTIATSTLIVTFGLLLLLFQNFSNVTPVASNFKGVYGFIFIPHAQPGSNIYLSYEAMIASNYIDGVSISVPWNLVESTKDVFDWESAIGHWVDLAVLNNKKLAIGIVAGARAPDWLKNDTDKNYVTYTYDLTIRNSTPTCITRDFIKPWGSIYRSRYLKLMASLKTYLNSKSGAYNLLSIVKLSGVNQTAVETRLTVTDRSDFRCRSNKVPGGRLDMIDANTAWNAGGYSPRKVFSTWSKLADATADLFPDKMLTLEIVKGSGPFPIRTETLPLPNTGQILDSVTQSMIDYALDGASQQAATGAWTNRFILQWNALGETSRPVMDAVIESGASHVAWQLNHRAGPLGTACGADYEDICAPSSYRKILDFGSSGKYKASVLEIHFENFSSPASPLLPYNILSTAQTQLQM